MNKKNFLKVKGKSNIDYKLIITWIIIGIGLVYIFYKLIRSMKIFLKL